MDPTLNAVIHAALLLIEGNTTTSTLEVKDLLRDIGYHAVQSDISRLMEEAAEEIPLAYTTTPFHYRTYSLPKVCTMSPTNDITEPEEDDSEEDSGIDGDSTLTTYRINDVAINVYDELDEITALGLTPARLSMYNGESVFFVADITNEVAISAHAFILGLTSTAGIVSYEIG